MDTLYKLFSAEDYLDGCHISVWRIEMDIFMALWVYMMKFPEVLGQEHLIFWQIVLNSSQKDCVHLFFYHQ